MTVLRRALVAIAGVVGIAGGAAPANAQECEPEFTQSAQTITLTATSVGPDVRIEASEDLRIRNRGSGECNAFLRISRFPAASLPGERNLAIASDGQVLDILPAEVSAASSASDLFVPGIPGGGVAGRAVPLRIGFTADWGVDAGTTFETLLVQLIDESGAVFDDLVLSVNMTVLPAVELRIVGATGADRIARIDLGALDPRRTTRSDPFGVRVWSTSPYTVTFASANAGALAHDFASDRIAYEMRAAGREVDLTGARPGALGRRTDGLGDLHLLEIAVPPFVAQAGDYTDRIVVTVSAG